MNLSKDPLSDEINEILEQWILRFIEGNPHMGLMCFESHYRVDPLLEFNNLKDAMDGPQGMSISRTINEGGHLLCF